MTTSIRLAPGRFLLAALLISATAAPLLANPTPFGAFRNNSTQSSAAVAAAIAKVPLNAGVVYDANGQTNDIQIWNFNTLLFTGAYDIATTLSRIRAGYCITAESDDGGFFNFNSGELPNIPRMGNNYYMEFTVWPSMDLTAKTYDESVKPYGTMTFPGAMRLLIGSGGEVYFTGDHYGEDGTQTNAYYVNPLPALPQLTITPTATNTVLVSWPAPATGFALQQISSLTTTNWVNVTNTPVVTGGQNHIVCPLPPAGALFFKLHYQ